MLTVGACHQNVNYQNLPRAVLIVLGANVVVGMQYIKDLSIIAKSHSNKHAPNESSEITSQKPKKNVKN